MFVWYMNSSLLQLLSQQSFWFYKYNKHEWNPLRNYASSLTTSSNTTMTPNQYNKRRFLDTIYFQSFIETLFNGYCTWWSVLKHNRPRISWSVHEAAPRFTSSWHGKWISNSFTEEFSWNKQIVKVYSNQSTMMKKSNLDVYLLVSVSASKNAPVLT